MTERGPRLQHLKQSPSARPKQSQDKLRLRALGQVDMYLRVYPVGIENAFKLYFAYLAALFMILLFRRRFRSIGHMIPGASKITVRVSGIMANIRPGTSDLGMLASGLEPRTASWFRVKRGDVVLDIGAHIGRYTLVAARKASIVVAVEPTPSNFSTLKENVVLNGFDNVISLPIAVSDRGGRSDLFISQDRDSAISSLEPNWSEKLSRTKGTKSVNVECETLDKLVTDLKLEVINWLKIDVEGHEVPVLRGGESTLKITNNLILEVTAGNEELCRSETSRAGLELVSTETRRGSLVSNWLLKRKL